MNPRTLRIFLIVLVLLFGIEGGSFGQGGGKTLRMQTGTWKSGREGSAKVTVDSVQKQLDKAAANAQLDETTKSKVTALYRQALEHLKAAESFKARRAAYQTAIETTPREIEDLGKKLPQIKKEGADRSLAALQRMSVQELESQVLAYKGELTTLQKKQETLEEELQDQKTRPVSLGEELSKGKRDLADIEGKIRSVRKSSEPGGVAEARLVELEARKQRYTEQVAMLDQELLSYNVRLKLLTAHYDLTSRMAAFRQEGVKALQGQIKTRRELELRKAAEEAALSEQALLTKCPQLSFLVAQNNTLNAELTKALEALGRTDRALEATSEEIKKIDPKFRDLKQRLEVPGMSRAMTPILRRARLQLPDINLYLTERKEREHEIESVSIRVVRVDDLAEDLGDIDAAAQRVMDDLLRSGLPAEEVSPVTESVRKVLDNQLALLQNLNDTYSRYLQTLWTLEFTQTELVNRAREFSAFLDSRLLWIPSGPSLWSVSFREFIQTASKTLSAFLRADLGRVISADAKANPFLMTGTACLLVLLFGIRGHLRKKLEGIAVKVSDPATDRFIYTVQVLEITLLSVLPLPVLLVFFGWRMEAAELGNEYSSALGIALNSGAVCLFLIGIFWRICDRHGMAQAHFGWNVNNIRMLRRLLLWFIVSFLPLLVLLKMFITIDQEEIYHGTLGRPLFILIMLVTAAFLQRLLRPKGGVMETYLIEHPEGVLSRFRHVWYPVSVLLPLGAAGIAAAGFVYTAVALGKYILRTALVISGAVLVHEFIMRWLRRIYQYHLLKRSNGEAFSIAVRAASPAEEPEEQAPDLTGQALRELSVMYERLRKLSGVVIALATFVLLYIIWAPFIPALSIFEEVILWNYTVATGGGESLQPFTLEDLCFTVVLIVAFVALARTLPGMLDLAVLQRLSVEAGTRYAINQISRYIILTVGVIAVFTKAGGDWSQIKLVVAALGVGIGFGLQEIVANVISGLVILFERPIRVGDTVTVGGVTGVVSRIRIRATTVIDWDNKELIVPNKTFVTEQVMNWTLSDSVVRLQVKVGIAYGSDTAMARDVILDTVKAHPLVLENPSPEVFFVGFGESSLDFLANVFLKGMKDRLSTTHDLNMAIDRALRQKGILIPFPQRDIHVHISGEENGGGSSKTNLDK